MKRFGNLTRLLAFAEHLKNLQFPVAKLLNGRTNGRRAAIHKFFGKERSKLVAPDIAAPLIAAVVKTTAIVKMATIEPMIANKKAFQLALDELHILPLNPVAA